MSTADLLPSESCFVAALQQLGFGRFEFLRIEHGALILDPWPTTVRDVKFCAKASQPAAAEEFLLKQQVVEFFEYVRSVGNGEIRILEVKNGLPFSMEIELRQNPEARA
ncbi:MAG: hypothetical protein ABSF98_25015 [Bryobacteraceae bacterium]|jgi:hypothetical protein